MTFLEIRLWGTSLHPETPRPLQKPIGLPTVNCVPFWLLLPATLFAELLFGRSVGWSNWDISRLGTSSRADRLASKSQLSSKMYAASMSWKHSSPSEFTVLYRIGKTPYQPGAPDKSDRLQILSSCPYKQVAMECNSALLKFCTTL